MTRSHIGELQKSISEILDGYAKHLGNIRPSYYVKERPDGPYLIIEFAKPSERHYRIHNIVIASLDDENAFKDRSTIQRRKEAPKHRLMLPETQLLRKEISQSLTVDQYSFDEDFFNRYTRSVTGFEEQVVVGANYIVYGRRGAGKSSLLAYAMRATKRDGSPYAWVSMQTFANRADTNVVPAVMAAFLYELKRSVDEDLELEKLFAEFERLSEEVEKDILSKCDRLIPRTRRLLGKFVSVAKPLTVFIDDIHVVDQAMQPMILAFMYKVARGNNVYIKISGISQLTNLWDSSSQMGMQSPHDVQILNLDNNLTMPDKSKEHIVGILSSHAQYCGLPDIGYLSGDSVLSRLVLVAAGVPRDSLSIFSLAISKALAKSQRLVSIVSINAAASEMAEEKLKDVEKDSGGQLQEIQEILSEVKEFCITQKRKNSFLVEIQNTDPRYQLIQKLIALRLVHLLHEGITPHEAGRRYIALMLDYGFYVGIRAAKSVELVPAGPHILSAKELRSLPIFR